MPKHDTISVYDARARDYLNKFDTDRPDPWFDAFAAAMPDGAHVLELGCGPGRTAAKFVAAGFIVDAVDGSAEMVRVAREAFDLNVRHTQFSEITGEGVYDGVWANFSLLHAPKAEFPIHMAALHRALKPGGRLHLGMKTGEGEKVDSIGRFYAYYTETELHDLLTTAGFTVIKSDLGQGKGMAGDVEPWVILTAEAANA